MNVNEILPDVEDYRQVKVLIGADSFAPQFEIDSVLTSDIDGVPIVLMLPDSVGDYFRKQGRRELQSELRQLLNSARA